MTQTRIGSGFGPANNLKLMRVVLDAGSSLSLEQKKKTEMAKDIKGSSPVLEMLRYRKKSLFSEVLTPQTCWHMAQCAIKIQNIKQQCNDVTDCHSPKLWDSLNGSCVIVLSRHV